jgi:nucleotide-binding universal stress UspA family protein
MGNNVANASVVAGVDGSSSALDAVAFATREAQYRQTTLRLVHANVWPMLDVPDGAGPGVPGLRMNAERQLAEAADVARRTAPQVEVETQLITGWPVPVLAHSSYGAELVVIGSHGSGRLVSGLVGSTAIELAATSHAPLVVVRQIGDIAFAPAEDAPVLVGLDGSRSSHAAAWFGAREAALVGAPLHVVQVGPTAAEEAAAQSLVDHLRLNEPSVAVELRAVDGHPARALIDASTYARLVVVGTRGQSGLVGLILGSVSHALLEHGICPIAVMPRPFVNDITWSDRTAASPSRPVARAIASRAHMPTLERP